MNVADLTRRLSRKCVSRVSQPDEIAHWVFQLVQGPYVTGETLVISGGSLIR